MNIINLAILAHVDAGKTTVTEGLLYHSGAIASMGRVDDGTTITDSMELEQKRGMTIRSTTVSFEWENTKINLIDTPGHMDFVAEVERSLSVVDGVVLVISAKEGVQPQTRVIFKKLQELHIPTIFFLNKIDRMGVCLEEVIGQIKQQLTSDILVLQEASHVAEKGVTVTDASIETQERKEEVLLRSEELLARYEAGEPITDEMYYNAMIQLTAQNQCYPMLLGSALSDVGITNLLSMIVTCFSNLTNLLEQTGFTAYVYKVERDIRHHKKCYIRMLSGAVIVRKKYMIYGKEGHDMHFTANSIWKMEHGKSMVDSFLEYKDIGILMDVEGLGCGDYILAEGADVPEKAKELSYQLAKPLLTVTVQPAQPEKRHDLLCALSELMEEDPFLQLMIHSETQEISIQLFGRLQMEVIETMLKQRYQIDIIYGKLATSKKEHPLMPATAMIPFGAGPDYLQACATVTIEPLPLGSGIEYVNKVSYGYLEKPFQNAVNEGIQKGLKEGLGGNEVIDARVIFADAFFSSVSSTPSDFRKLMPHVIRKVLKETGVELLEPWLSYEITIPNQYDKELLSDLNKMKAVIDKMDYDTSELKVVGTIPLDTSKEFGTQLQTYTEGKGIFTTKFYRFQ